MTNNYLTIISKLKSFKMYKLLSIAVVILLGVSSINAQTIDDLKKQRDAKAAEQADLQGKADALAGEVASLSDQIIKLSGWRTGVNGTVGLNFNKNNQWAKNDNASAGFNVGLTAFANQDKDKFFWNNKGILVKAWQDVDQTGDTQDDGLFDEENSAADIINVASLAGYKLTDNFALSGLGDWNTSVGNFDTGTFDIGIGATWTPLSNLVIVMHPLNYHSFYSPDGFGGNGALGAKIRADYTDTLPIWGNAISWTSTFTTFFPYQEAAIGETDLNEWQWINNFNFKLFNNIGVGVGFGFRDIKAVLGADGLPLGVQSYSTIGLSAGF